MTIASITNGESGASVRTSLNAVIDAINNKTIVGGATTQVQYNNAGVLAGSANFVFDGTNSILGGTLTAASFIPTSATVPTNGMFLPSANTLAWALGSAEKLRLDSTGLGINKTPASLLDITTTNSVASIKLQATGAGGTVSLDLLHPNGSWEIGTDNAGNGTSNNQWYVYQGGYRLTVQNGTGNVGIGTTSADAVLHVAKSADSGVNLLKLQNTSVANNTTKNVGMLFSGKDTGGGTKDVAKILVIPDAGNTDWFYGTMAFYTYYQGSSYLAERMRIQYDGNIGIGNTSPRSLLTLSGGSLNKAAFTVATLPGSPVVGDEARVTDALVPVIGSTVANGGSANAGVVWNGANWTVNWK